MRSTIGGHEIRGIAVCPEDHVAGMETDDGIWMGGTVVEELGESLQGSLGAMCLLGGKGTKSDQQSGINCMGIICKSTPMTSWMRLQSAAFRAVV